MKNSQSSTEHSKKLGENSKPIQANAPDKKGGSIIAILALFMALGAGAVSSYFYTELQKYRGQTGALVQESANDLKAGIGTNIDSVENKIQKLGAEFKAYEDHFSATSNQLKNQLTSALESNAVDFSDRIEAVDQQLSSKVDTLNKLLINRIDESNNTIENRTSTQIADILSKTTTTIENLSTKSSTDLSAFASESSKARQTLKEDTNSRLETLNSQIASLSKQLQETNALATRGQRDWILAEIEYLLRTANYRVNLAGDTKSGVMALRAASERIHDLGDPEFTTVREQISDEVAELRQVGIPDIEGIAFELQKLSSRADKLPLPPSDIELVIKTAKEEPSEIDAKAMAGQLFQSIKEFVKVEKSDGTPIQRPGKPTKEQLTASEGLRLNLQAARLSALRRDAETYLLEMSNAEKYINNNYDLNSNFTKAFLEDLSVLKVQNIIPSVTKLGQALILFNQIHSQRGEN